VSYILPKIAIEDQVGLAIHLMSMTHAIESTVDRYYSLIVANWVLVRVSLQLLRSRQSSTLFMLFSE
jgi:hypothetical protein